MLIIGKKKVVLRQKKKDGPWAETPRSFRNLQTKFKDNIYWFRFL